MRIIFCDGEKKRHSCRLLLDRTGGNLKGPKGRVDRNMLC